MDDSTETTKTLWKNICVPISMILLLVLNELLLPVMALAEQLKQRVAKRSLQMSSYKAILDLCENEMMLINFFEFVTRSSHNLFTSIVILAKWY